MGYRIESIENSGLALTTFGGKSFGGNTQGYRVRVVDETTHEVLVFDAAHMRDEGMLCVAYEQLQSYRKVEGDDPIGMQIQAAVERALEWWNDSAES